MGLTEIYATTGGRHLSSSKTPVLINEAKRSSALRDLGKISSYRDLLYFLTWRDIKVRYKQAAMGAAWAIIQPLAIMLIFAVFFGLFMGFPTGGIPHTIFFYSG